MCTSSAAPSTLARTAPTCQPSVTDICAQLALCKPHALYQHANRWQVSPVSAQHTVTHTVSAPQKSSHWSRAQGRIEDSTTPSEHCSLHCTNSKLAQETAVSDEPLAVLTERASVYRRGVVSTRTPPVLSPWVPPAGITNMRPGWPSWCMPDDAPTPAEALLKSASDAIRARQRSSV